MSDGLKNVVIVGAAVAGVELAQALTKTLPSTHRLVLIEANPVAYWSLGALRAAVTPGFEDKVVHTLSTETIFGEGSRHVVLPATRVVDLGHDHVVVDRDPSSLLNGTAKVEDGKWKIPQSKVVLAVGSTYSFPAQLATGVKTLDDALNQFRTLQRQIKDAQDILVVGGGPTGVEFVGEVLDEHPNKKITLVTAGKGLVTKGNDSFGGLSNKLISQLRAKGVRVILDDRLDVDGLQTGPLGAEMTFTTKKGEKLTADFVMIGSGGKPNTAWLQNVDPTIVDAATNLIKVRPTFQVDGSDRWANYFAIGDCAATPGPNMAYTAKTHVPPLAHNIVASIKGEPEAKLKKAPGPQGSVIVVPVGRHGGASYLMLGSVGGFLTGIIKGKTLFISQFDAWFKA